MNHSCSDLYTPASPLYRRRHPHLPKSNTIRVWTIQPPSVWQSLQQHGTLFVDPTHPNFCDTEDDRFRIAYDWLHEQMARRLPNYEGHYPWWAYEHFLDLRPYRHWMDYLEGPQVRLGLAVPKERVLLLGYGGWHSVVGGRYLSEALDIEEEAVQADVNLNLPDSIPEPWNSQMRACWERVFDVESRRPTETIQAVFERLELDEVIDVTEFTLPSTRR